jgi:hypothetical protein
MPTALLRRIKSDDQGTFGELYSWGFSCVTLELPWRDNSRNISCIPTGKYKTRLIYSQKFKDAYWLEKVEDRTGILIHAGTWGGDKEKGFKTHTYGCILLGKYSGIYQSQKAIFYSKPIVNAFIDWMKKEPFELEVRNA